MPDLASLRLAANGSAPRTAGHCEPDTCSRQEAGAAYVFALITDRGGFDALETEWNALFERAGCGAHMFQTFNWLWHWCNHYLAEPGNRLGPHLFIVTARREGRLVLVWPLVRECSWGISKLVWMGEPVSQYGDVLVDDGPDALPVMRAAWRVVAARSNAHVVQLRKVRADASIAPFLAEAAGAKVTETLRAPYLDLAGAASFADYEKRYSSGARRNRRRQRRRLEERGPAAVQAHTGGAGARELARFAISLKRAWLRERALVSSALSEARFERFFEDVAEARIRPAGCHVLVLSCHGAPAALEIGLRCKDRTAIHVIVYDPAFEKVAAGSLLMEDSISCAIEDGFSSFDLLAPDDTYKLDWADGVAEVNDWVAPLTLAGRIYSRLYLGWLRETGKRLFLVLPVPVRRFVATGISGALPAL